MSTKSENKDPMVSLVERVAKLETNVQWLIRLAVAELTMLVGILLTLIGILLGG